MYNINLTEFGEKFLNDGLSREVDNTFTPDTKDSKLKFCRVDGEIKCELNECKLSKLINPGLHSSDLNGDIYYNDILVDTHGKVLIVGNDTELNPNAIYKLIGVVRYKNILIDRIV